jgi:predicted TIM-barrel fold metal-dependent hydrolase
VHIDTHSHWLAPSFFDALVDEAERSESMARRAAALTSQPPESPARDLTVRIAEMDACGVDVSVLSLPPPAATFGDATARAAIASRGNDELLAAADTHAGRFAVLLSLPLPHVDASLAELDRVASHPQARGVEILTATDGYSVDDPAFEPLYAGVAGLGLPVMTHPAIEEIPGPWREWALGSSLGAVTSSSLGVARLALSGMLDRVPELELIVPHLGGTLPYLAQRFVDFGTGDGGHDLLHYLRNRMYLDTCSFHPPAFHCACETVGAERLVLGSDYPYRGPLARAVQDVVDALPDPGLRELVLGGTAARWFAPG